MNRQNQRNWDNNPHQHFSGGYDYGSYTSGNEYENQDFQNQDFQNQNQNQNRNMNMNQDSWRNDYQNQNFRGNNYPNQDFGRNDYQNRENQWQRRPYYPNVSGVREDDFGGNDHGYSGGNPGFENEVDEYIGYGRDESNNDFGVGSNRNQGFYRPQNNRQSNSRSGEFNWQNEYNNSRNLNQSGRPSGQTMDSWDNDFNHWRTHRFRRGHFGMEENRDRNDNNRNQDYRSQNQGYFGENITPHSGGNLYNDRFRNNESRTRYNNEEGRWHANSLSDGNIDSWGR